MTDGRGTLVLVATPIGNLGDLSSRAVEVLAGADVLCCEDTRRTRALLSAAGVRRGRRLVSMHGGNEVARTREVLGWLGEGRTVALVSDAGMPALSDPGERLVAAAWEQGARVTVVPGPTSITAALAVSGLPAARFCMEGFLPRSGGTRRSRLEALAGEERTVVLLEAPGRLARTLADLHEACGNRSLAVVRELTKVHEEVWRGTLAEAVSTFTERPVRGEVVVVLGGAPSAEPVSDDALSELLRERMAAGDTPRTAAEHAATMLDVPRRRAYNLALASRLSANHARPERRV